MSALVNKYTRLLKDSGEETYRSTVMKQEKLQFRNGFCVLYFSCEHGNFLNVEDMINCINTELNK